MSPVRLIVLTFGVMLLANMQPSLAQSNDDYTHGYTDGYAGRMPSSGIAPDPSSDYGRGFQAGQEDAETDDNQDQRNTKDFERSLRSSLGQSPVQNKDGQ
jgi:hypothetical protein